MKAVTKCRRSRGVLAAVACAALGAVVFATASELPDQNEVEAAYLYRIAGYVDWPQQPAASQDFTIAVMGSDTVLHALQNELPNHFRDNWPVRVRRIRRLEDLGSAQILFVGPELNDDLKSLISRLGKRPVLVVSASEHGLTDGSCVNFLFVDHRVRFEVSLTAAEHAGLKVSAELLSVAVRVQGRSP